jgi:Xaa-Pro aminopeptidase
VEAALDAGFRARGASGPAFPTIVAAGPNATVLHYVENGCTLQAGQLVLLDAGARRAMYCADISRTFPVGGRFTPEQRRLYDGVLAARDAAIACVRPGASVRDVHDAALRVLLETLRELGFLPGTVEQALEQEDDYKPFYPHRTSHWLGLDVHDVGDYRLDGESRLLEPGMVFTVEPGLYVMPDDASVAAKWRGIGIRTEDDAVVTRDGHRVLTRKLARSADEIEAFMAR